MARLVALEWDAREARVAVGRTRGKDVVVEEAFSVELLPRDPGQTFADVNIGEKVAAALAARGVSKPETLVAVGRASIELRLLQIPPAPPEELPDLVRFQAMRQFATIGEDWSLDFVELRPADPDSVSVLAAAISPELIGQIRQTCEAGELQAEHLVLRPFAAAQLLHRSDAVSDSGCRLMVDMLTDEADLTVLVDGQVAFLRTVRLPSIDDTKALARALVSEIRRTIGAAQNQLRDQRVGAIIICGRGGDNQDVKEALESSLQLPVDCFDPFQHVTLGRELQTALPQHSGRYAPLLGLLTTEAHGARHGIDFLNPRRRPKPEGRGRKAVLLAALAATVVLAAAGLILQRMWSLDAEIAELAQQSRELDKVVAWSDDRVREVEQIEEFTGGDVNWLEELRELSGDLPLADQARVTKLSVGARPPLGGRMIVEGYVRDSATISELEERLRDEHHRVVGKGGSFDDLRRDFPWRFNETVTIEREPPDPTETASSTTEPPAADGERPEGEAPRDVREAQSDGAGAASSVSAEAGTTEENAE